MDPLKSTELKYSPFSKKLWPSSRASAVDIRRWTWSLLWAHSAPSTTSLPPPKQRRHLVNPWSVLPQKPKRRWRAGAESSQWMGAIFKLRRIHWRHGRGQAGTIITEYWKHSFICLPLLQKTQIHYLVRKHPPSPPRTTQREREDVEIQHALKVYFYHHNHSPQLRTE